MTKKQFIDKYNINGNLRFVMIDKVHKNIHQFKTEDEVNKKIVELFKDEITIPEYVKNQELYILNEFSGKIKLLDIWLETANSPVDNIQLFFWETGDNEYGWYERLV